MKIVTSFPFTKNNRRINLNYQELFSTLCTSRTSVTKEAAESGSRKTLNKPVNQINMAGVTVFDYFDYKS